MKMNKKLSLNSKNINTAIKDHEISENDWYFNKYARDCYLWMGRFNKEFFNSKLTMAVLSFERSRITTLGHYVTERNAIGVNDNINLNSIHLCREKWQILSTLLHEMVHQYQRRLGSFSDKEKVKGNNYHNKEFLDMTESFGLIHNKKGQRIAPPTGRFVSFLKKYNVEITKEKHYERKVGISKLKKYICQFIPAINIRVGKSEFSATCNKFRKEFELA